MQRINIRHVYISLVAILSLGLAINGWKFLPRLRAAAVATAPAPYTVKLRLTYTNPAGSLVDPRATLTIAVRSDGARAIVHSQRHPKGDEVSRSVQFPSGQRIEIGDLWEIKTSWNHRHQKPVIAQWYRSPQSNCLTNLMGDRFIGGGSQEIFVAEESVGGHRAARITRGGNATEWLALDAGCAILKSEHQFKDSASKQELLALIPGEPDPLLFSAPSSFREVRPSEYTQVMVERLGLPCTGQCLESRKKDDELYEKQRN